MLNLQNKPYAWGLVVDASGLIVTPSFAGLQYPLNQEVKVRLADDGVISTKVLKVDTRRELALLLADSNEKLTPLEVIPSRAVVGQRVMALACGGDGKELRIEIGSILRLAERGTGVPKDQQDWARKIQMSFAKKCANSGGVPGSRQ